MLQGIAQTHHFLPVFNIDDGLPDTVPQCCVQDIYGRLWVGSRGDGVFFHTGTHFMKFSNERYLNACSSNTTCIVEDSDHDLWVGSTAGAGYYDIDTDSFCSIEGLQDARILDIDIDNHGDVWITTSQGIYKYLKSQNELEIQIQSNDYSPYRACVSDNGEVIFTASTNSIYIYSIETGALKSLDLLAQESSFRLIEYLSDNKVLVSEGKSKVCEVDLSSGKLTIILDQSIIKDVAEIRNICCSQGSYWIGTTFGLVIYNPITQEMEIQFPDKIDDYTLGAKYLLWLYPDKSGNMWACTLNDGVRCWMKYEEGFIRYFADSSIDSIVGNSVRSICPAPDGYIWIGTEEGFLNCFDPETQIFADYTAESKIKNSSIRSMKLIGNELWIATSGDGVHVFDPVKRQSLRHYNLPCKYCMDIAQTDDGAIYIGTAEGLFLFNPLTEDYALVSIVGRQYINCLLYDGSDHLLIGTFGQGLGILDISRGSYQRNVLGDKDVITSLSIYQGNDLWICTDGNGIKRTKYSLLDGSLSNATTYDKSSGMPSNRICAVVEDKDGILWISTIYGLVEFNPTDSMINKVYMQNDYVLGSRFIFGGHYVSDGSHIYFGSCNGLLGFNPDYIRDIFDNIPLQITEVVPGDMISHFNFSPGENSILSSSKQVRIKQKDATFLTIAFSNMSYSNPNKEKYTCVLSRRGFNSKYTTDEPMVTYSNLRPGVYDFSVNYCGKDNEDTEATLQLSIIAPWYRSKVFIITYLSFLLLLIMYLLRLFIQKREEIALRNAELVEAKREKELSDEKMAFFTNIAHEIRTPVSIILILLDKIKNHSFSKDIEDDFRSMQINAERLQKQCDELLDFRRIEYGTGKICYLPADIYEIVRKSFYSFEQAARQKNVDVDFNVPDSRLLMMCDADAVENIICNLVSNAIKYCESKISISLEEQNDKVLVRVDSDGRKISNEEAEKIFEPFYQIKRDDCSGTGLGLTYSKQLAKMHLGDLYLDISNKECNSFILELPIDLPQGIDDIEQDEYERIKDDKSDSSGMLPVSKRATILIVEDNISMKSLLRDELSKTYDILEAMDGESAYEIVRKGRVDLVLSDIMMPKMDGCELCDAIKQDIQLSHIPVVLLTAAVGIDTHIRSLKSGADAYIEKPFKMDILLASINNLFMNRDIRKEQLSLYPLSYLNSTSPNNIDQDFLEDLHKYVNENLTDVNLTIDKLAEKMAVSRNTLTRKVKAYTGVTVNKYINNCRMKKAVELLSDGHHRINEVAYQVGFSSPSYFAKVFQNQFGKLPKEFIK